MIGAALLKRAGLPLSLPMLLLMLTGCSREVWYAAQVPWGYVFEIGSAAKIGEWTLSQTDVDHISDGICTLIAIPGLRSTSEGRQAVESYVTVHRKLLDGWPMPNGRLEDTSVRSLLSMSRQIAFQETKGYPDNELVQRRWKKVQEIDPGALPEIKERQKRSGPGLFHSRPG